MQSIPAWSRRSQTILRTFELGGFLARIAFVKRIAKKAQQFSHHSGILIHFDKVTLTLSTHGQGGIDRTGFHPGPAMRGSLCHVPGLVSHNVGRMAVTLA